MPDLSGNGLTGLLPNGGIFNGDYLYLNSASNQWVNISTGLRPYLNTQDYSIMGYARGNKREKKFGQQSESLNSLDFFVVFSHK